MNVEISYVYSPICYTSQKYEVHLGVVAAACFINNLTKRATFHIAMFYNAANFTVTELRKV